MPHHAVTVSMKMTVAVLKHTLEPSNDENPYMRDIVLWNQIEGDGCNEVDLLAYGILIMPGKAAGKMCTL